jgi:hypothetical protein
LKTKKNIIILTGGLAGSSVLTSLLGRAGYWSGKSTIKKVDYDTWENSELVSLNEQILTDVGFDKPWMMKFEPDYVDSVVSGLSAVDDVPAKAFMQKCNEHSPWIWKDPRLWLTIRYWQRFIDFSSTVFLVIHRELLQAWISTTIRKQIQTRDYLRRYNDGIHGTIMKFVEEDNAQHMNILYEDLIVDPESTIKQINALANTELSVADFEAIFRGDLYRKQHGLRSFSHASAIYLKNFRDRYH